MGRIIQPIGDKIIIPKKKIKKPKMWMGREDQMPPGMFYPKLSKKGILSPGSSGGSASQASEASYTLRDSYTTDDDDLSVFDGATHKWMAGSFKAGASYTLTKFEYKLYKSGSPVMILTGYIYSGNVDGDPPISLLGTSNNTVDSSTLSGTSPGDFTAAFTFDGVSITANNYYYVVISASATSASHYVKARVNWDGLPDAGYCRFAYDDNGAFTGTEGAIGAIFKTYSGG